MWLAYKLKTKLASSCKFLYAYRYTFYVSHTFHFDDLPILNSLFFLSMYVYARNESCSSRKAHRILRTGVGDFFLRYLRLKVVFICLAKLFYETTFHDIISLFCLCTSIQNDIKLLCSKLSNPNNEPTDPLFATTKICFWFTFALTITFIFHYLCLLWFFTYIFPNWSCILLRIE